MKYLCCLIILSFLSGLSGESFPLPDRTENPKQYIAYQITDSLTIDGKLDEPVWGKTEWTDSFVDILGIKGEKPFYDTKVKMAWSKHYLYIGARLEEQDLWSVLQKRDEVVFFDNDFEIFIDPDDDTHDYAELEINTLNTVWDLLIIKPYRDRHRVAYNSWDYKDLQTAVYCEGTVNDARDRDQYWSIEIAIPWTSLSELTPKPCPPIDGDLWRMNFSRVQWPLDKIGDSYQKTKNKPEWNWVWSPQGIVAMHYPERWGTVQFSGLAPGDEKAIIVRDSLYNEKTMMRLVYYAQKQYMFKNGKYAETPEALMRFNHGIPELNQWIKKSKFNWKTSKHTYEITLLSPEDREILYVFHDGRLLKSIDWDH